MVPYMYLIYINLLHMHPKRPENPHCKRHRILVNEVKTLIYSLSAIICIWSRCAMLVLRVEIILMSYNYTYIYIYIYIYIYQGCFTRTGAPGWLTHCGLAIPYGDIELGQHGLRYGTKPLSVINCIMWHTCESNISPKGSTIQSVTWTKIIILWKLVPYY